MKLRKILPNAGLKLNNQTCKNSAKTVFLSIYITSHVESEYIQIFKNEIEKKRGFLNFSLN